MEFGKFRQVIGKILEAELPKGKAVIDEGRSISGQIRIGRTAFMDRMGVSSEAEYKRACMKEGRVMFHAHIGMSSWAATSRALAYIHSVAEESGFVIDRAGLCLDRRMALPEKLRHTVRAETGPMLEGEADWKNLAQVAPIQPHMGDFMIGFPGSTENTVQALKVGITTVGNLSQFFSHEVPYWNDQATTTAETVKAIALMGAFRDRGTLVHSYLEDGYGALFQDCCTVAGWALLERHIVENLIGAKLTHCNGGLTSDPVKRAGWIFALDEIHEHDCVGSMFYGDTISFTEDFNINRGLIAEYITWDVLAQLECPTGHAVLPLPVTEAVRVPSGDEIAEAHVFGRRVEQLARRLRPHVSFEAPKTFARTIVDNGRKVCENALSGLEEAGVDTKDPVELLYVLKKMKPGLFEEMFGVGPADGSAESGHCPIVPTDVFHSWKNEEEKIMFFFRAPAHRKLLQGKKILIASTDVHEHALFLIRRVLSDADVGAEVIDLGAEVDPDEIAREAIENSADAVMISTHNGMALEYCKEFKVEMLHRDLSVPIFVGGVLNQKFEEQEMPVDVTDEIARMGFHPCIRLQDMIKVLEGSF